MDVSESVVESESNRVTQFPPCRVCGDRASGFHYGVCTCEACKIFFIRSLRCHPKYKYLCSNTTQCQITANSRTCHICRFQRCLSIGMSKTAIKVGKYTDHKRQQIREEVAKRAQVLRVEAEQNTEELYREMAQQLLESSKAHDVYSVIPRDPVKLLQRQKDYSVRILRYLITRTIARGEIANNIGLLCLTSHMGYGSRAMPRPSLAKLHPHLARVGIDLSPNYLTIDFKKTIQVWYWSCHSAIGERNPLSESEYNEFYAATGLDIDNRNKILNGTLSMFQHGIEKQVQFSKTIPGFRKLSLSDQANIIKASSFDYLWLCGARCMNAELGIGASHNGCLYTLEYIRNAIDEQYMRVTFRFSGKLNQLGLLDEETALLKAVCIMFTDRVLLEDKSTVDRIHWNLIECLRWHITRNHSNHKQTFYKLWNCVLTLREISEKSRQFIGNVHMRCPENENCALLRETSIS